MRALILAFALALSAVQAPAQSGCAADTICGTIEDFSVKPLPIALPLFVAETPDAEQLAADITAVVTSDLLSTGLFREIPRSAHIAQRSSFDAPVQFSNWTPINAEALVIGAVSQSGGRVEVKFRLFDTFNGRELGEGQRFGGSANTWRRFGHKVADQVYSRLTGEGGYFDSRIVFVSETGPKNARRKQIAIMDQDGANARNLTQPGTLVLSPRFSPDGNRVIFTTYASGRPQVALLDLATGQVNALGVLDGVSFAPRFSPDGRRIVYSQGSGSNTDLFELDLNTGQRRQLTQTTAIETAPSYSPDASQIVFESDRGGSQQLYIMSANGGEARRISFGQGRYGTPVWSPRGDLVAFTKMVGGRFHIGVMKTDGSQERLLTASFLDEGPTWAPNGRVLMFFREPPGASGAPGLYSVDITGRNLRRVSTPAFASDPSWSRLLP
ncbi:MAG: Tol-Pal system beta propeller repeat protein TolB [Pseudomonadota bacterium]